MKVHRVWSLVSLSFYLPVSLYLSVSPVYLYLSLSLSISLSLSVPLSPCLSLSFCCEAVCKKGHQRLHCLRKLSSFNIDKTMMSLFYCAFIESILTFSLASWFVNLSLKNKNPLKKIVKWSSKLIGEPQPNIEALYTKQLQRKSQSIQSDN